MTVKDLLFSFEGRIPRRWYWAGFGIQMAIGVVVAMLCFLVMGAETGMIVFIILMLPMVYTGWAIGTKRWHDRNKSGWWNCIQFIPYIGGIWMLIECGCLRGTMGPNNYGEDPT